MPKHLNKAANQKIEPETVCTIQSYGKERKVGFETRDLPTMQNTSDIPYISFRTISSLYQSRKRNNFTRTRRNRRRFTWKVERIVKSEIITYVRRRRWMQEIRYFVNWAECSEDENTWETPESLENAEELVEAFHGENPEMPKLDWGWMKKKGFPCGELVNTERFFTLLSRVQEREIK